MVQLTVALLIVGVIFLLIEMWLPGMEFFAAIGLIALAVSAVLAVMFVPGGWFIVAGQLVIIAGFMLHMYRFMKRKQLKGHLILSENLNISPVEDITYLMGREGKAITTLKPYGEADFNGVRVEVASYGPMISKGTKISVIEVIAEAKKVVVRPVEGN